MHPDELGPLLIERLRQAGLKVDVIMDFTGRKNRATVTTEWLDKGRPPKGEILNRLWHLLAAAEVPSPELEKLEKSSPFGFYLGKLLAYSVITADDALTMCGIKYPQGVLEIIRGDKMPVSAIFSVEELQQEYDEQLRVAVAELAENLGQGTSAQQAPVAKIAPADSTPSNSDPMVLIAASKIAAVAPFVTFLLQASDEQRADLRKWLDADLLFLISTGLNRLCSPTAFNKGK
jgi:hypothetical protein